MYVLLGIILDKTVPLKTAEQGLCNWFWMIFFNNLGTKFHTYQL